ncbi:MAG: ABC transporter ATP-binding protein [Gammaproteobacteria bacterium]|nr:ABC transporter ATP-binding protein [Gammaproteobacteria bacterium]
MSLLEVSGLRISYGGSSVVDGVDFAVANGESVGVVGESGSGKSQTALALLGLLPADAVVEGSVEFDGQQIIGAPEEKLNKLRGTRIAMIFQDPMQALNPYLRVGRQLSEVLRQHQLAEGQQARKTVLEMLTRVGLSDAERQYRAYPHELSGGMRQRVMIASALITGPDLLIADEPTTALDVTVQAQILDLLEELRDDTALLLITHDLGIVAGRCERLLVFEGGQLVESGATTSLFAAPRHEHTRKLLEAAPRVDVGKTLAPAADKSILSVEDVAVQYRSNRGEKLDAVTSVSLSLREGETLAIVGESGSGKSSLVRGLLGLVPMSSGKLVFAGEALSGPVQKRTLQELKSLQLVFQDPVSALNPQMTVGKIVAEPLEVHAKGISASERESRALKMLSKVGLDKALSDRYSHQLSGGQAQRVAIARALILEPKVLVCDEAVAALDGSARERVLDVIKSAQAETGLSVIFISHDLGVVRSVSHRVAVMYLGRLVEIAENGVLFATPRHPYTRALLASIPVADPRAKIVRAPLQGEVPSALEPPAGCVFHTRCPFVDDACKASAPELRDVAGSRVACLRAGQIQNATEKPPSELPSAHR